MILLRQKQYGIPGEMAKAGLRAMGRGAAVSAVGKAGMAAGAGTLASAGLLKLGTLAAAHPILSGAAVLGGLGYAIHRFLKKRRERKAQERGYSVIERMFSNIPKDELRVKRVVDAEKLMRLKRFSDSSEYIDPNEPYVPKGPREAVPKKIVKKAKKSGVVQKDSNGNWRIINMNSPQGPVYWKPVYKSKESASAALRSFEMGKWRKK